MDLFFFVLPVALVAAGYIVPGWNSRPQALQQRACGSVCRQR